MRRRTYEQALHDIELIERHPSLAHAARAAGVSRTTLVFRKELAGRLYGLELGKPRPPKPEEKQPAAGSEPAEPAATIKSPIDRRITELEDENRGLRAALREAHRAEIDGDAIREILGGISAAPTKPPEWIKDPIKKKGQPDPEVPVTIWADWHTGEVVVPAEVNGFNEFNLEILDKRVRRLVDGTINLCLNHHSGNYPGIVVNLAGDFVSGGIHPELAKTDEFGVIPSALRSRDLLVGALTRIADVFGKVYVPCVCGNHGRNTPKPEFKRYVEHNFDWLIYQLLIRHFANDKRIEFDVRPSNDVSYKVYGVRYLLVHGDMLGVKGGDGIIGAIGPIMRGEVKKARQSAALGRAYDVLLLGHWHQPLLPPRAIVSNTLKGFDEYARLQLDAVPTEPTQPLWFVHPSRGRTAYWEVSVSDEKEPSKDWIAVLQ